MNHQRENRTVPYTNTSKKNEINLTEEQKHLYNHRLQDIESAFKSHLTLTCRVTQGKSHNDLRLNIFNSKWTEIQLSSSQGCETPRKCLFRPRRWSISRSFTLYETPLQLGSPDPVGEGQVQSLGAKWDQTRTRTKKNASSVSGREATSFSDLRVGPAPRAWVLNNQM